MIVESVGPYPEMGRVEALLAVACGPMWGRFTDRSRRVLVFAAAEASVTASVTAAGRRRTVLGRMAARQDVLSVAVVDEASAGMRAPEAVPEPEVDPDPHWVRQGERQTAADMAERDKSADTAQGQPEPGSEVWRGLGTEAGESAEVYVMNGDVPCLRFWIQVEAEDLEVEVPLDRCRGLADMILAVLDPVDAEIVCGGEAQADTEDAEDVDTFRAQSCNHYFNPSVDRSEGCWVWRCDFCGFAKPQLSVETPYPPPTVEGSDDG